MERELVRSMLTTVTSLSLLEGLRDPENRTTWGDFVAIAAPSRWKSPIATGGSLSWLNPVAWSEDAGRTGRILLGEAIVVGGAVAAVGASGSDGGASDIPPDSSTGVPPPPTSGGGGTLPPAPEL